MNIYVRIHIRYPLLPIAYCLLPVHLFEDECKIKGSQTLLLLFAIIVSWAWAARWRQCRKTGPKAIHPRRGQ